MAAQLKASNEKIQKNEQNRKELFSGISHDLRSPLTSIKAFAEGLLVFNRVNLIKYLLSANP